MVYGMEIFEVITLGGIVSIAVFLYKFTRDLRGDLKELGARVDSDLKALGARVDGLADKVSDLTERVARIEGFLTARFGAPE